MIKDALVKRYLSHIESSSNIDPIAPDSDMITKHIVCWDCALSTKRQRERFGLKDDYLRRRCNYYKQKIKTNSCMVAHIHVLLSYILDNEEHIFVKEKRK